MTQKYSKIFFCLLFPIVLYGNDKVEKLKEIRILDGDQEKLKEIENYKKKLQKEIEIENYKKKKQKILNEDKIFGAMLAAGGILAADRLAQMLASTLLPVERVRQLENMSISQALRENQPDPAFWIKKKYFMTFRGLGAFLGASFSLYSEEWGEILGSPLAQISDIFERKIFVKTYGSLGYAGKKVFENMLNKKDRISPNDISISKGLTLVLASGITGAILSENDDRFFGFLLAGLPAFMGGYFSPDTLKDFVAYGY